MNCSYIFSSIFPYWLYIAVFASFLFLVLPVFIYVEKRLTNRILLGLIFVGGACNFYYRITSTCVPDYLNFFGLFKFNIADILITASSLTLIVLLLIKDSMPKN